MIDTPLDVIGVIEEELRTRLKAAHMKGYTLVTIPSAIVLSTGPNRRKAVMSWENGGRKWCLELTPEYTGNWSKPKNELTIDGVPNRGCNKSFDIYTADIERVLDIMVSWVCGYDITPRELGTIGDSN